MKTEKIKEAIINEANKGVHKFVIQIKGLALVGIVVSVFLLIWMDGWLPLQISATSVFIIVIAWFIKESVDKTASSYIDAAEVNEIRRKLGTFSEKVEPKKASRSKFQQRLDKAMEDARKNKE